mgnify:FL=1
MVWLLFGDALLGITNLDIDICATLLKITLCSCHFTLIYMINERVCIAEMVKGLRCIYAYTRYAFELHSRVAGVILCCTRHL